jgi:hypothetical protein
VLVTIAVAVPVSIVATNNKNNSQTGSTSALSDGNDLCATARPTQPPRAPTNLDAGGLLTPRYLIRNIATLYTGDATSTCPPQDAQRACQA